MRDERIQQRFRAINFHFDFENAGFLPLRHFADLCLREALRHF